MKNRFRPLPGWVFVLSVAALAAGPETRPADPGAEVRSAAAAAVRAGRGSDFAAFKATHDCSEVGYQINEYRIKRADAIEKVAAAVKDRFGLPASKPFTDKVTAMRDRDSGFNLAGIPRAKVTIFGGRATVEIPSDSEPGTTATADMHRTAGTWKLIDRAAAAPGFDTKKGFAIKEKELKVLADIATDVAAGKYDSPSNAYLAVLHSSYTAEGKPIPENEIYIPPDFGQAHGTGSGHSAGTGFGSRAPYGAAADRRATTGPAQVEFVTVLASWAYDRHLLKLVDDPTGLKLSDDQLRKWKAATDAGIDADKAVDQKHSSEMDSIVRHQQNIRSNEQLAGGHISPYQQINELRANESYYRDMADAASAQRLALRAILTPDLRIDWDEIYVKEKLTPALGVAKLSAGQTAAFEKLCRTAAESIGKHPIPRDPSADDQIITKAWQDGVSGIFPQ